MTIQELQKCHQLYERWKKAFPFDLPYFVQFKNRLEYLPNFLLGKTANSHNFVVATNINVKDEFDFINRLTDLTSDILEFVNIPKLRSKALIKNVEETRLILSGEKLRIMNESIFRGFSSNELKYVESLERWLDVQIKYFKDNEDIFIKLTKENAQEVNRTDEGEIVPLFQALKESGLKVTLTDNVEYIKKQRQTSFNQWQTKFISDYKKRGSEPDSEALRYNEIEWLEKEIRVISYWLKDSTGIYLAETMKYQDYVNSRIEGLKKGNSPKSDTIKLTINQIALKSVYEELQVTRENGNEIVKAFGHKSGEKLFQRFTYYSSSANRKGQPEPCTPRKLKNKIQLLESVIALLSDVRKQRAIDEVSILKAIQETEYQ